MYGNSLLVDTNLSNNIWSSSKLESALNFSKLNKTYSKYDSKLTNNYQNNNTQINMNNYENSIF